MKLNKMISKQNLLELINQDVIFLGYSDEDNFKASNVKTRTDWHSQHFLYYKTDNQFKSPYNKKVCRIEGQNVDGSIQVSFPQCDFDGNILNGERAVMSFEFSDSSDGLINYNPIFVQLNNNNL